MSKYLFLVPFGCFGDWQTATIKDKVVVTDNTKHFGGAMPVVFASKELLASGNYYDFEANLPQPPFN